MKRIGKIIIEYLLYMLKIATINFKSELLVSYLQEDIK